MKKAIIIGASSGIGKGLAKLLADDGYNVGITGRRTEMLVELQREKPESFFVKELDVTEANTVVKKLQELATELDGLDMLIISAGTGDFNANLDFAIEKRTIDTNVTGFALIAGWAFNYFENQKYGHLVGITSIGGLRGNRQAPSYMASKAFQIKYLEGLRQKATKLKQPIFVTDIRPGLVDTDMAKGDVLFWVMPVEKVARQIYDAVKRKKKIVYVTRRWGLLASVIKRLPRQIYDRM